jgi:hypothetical protein
MDTGLVCKHLAGLCCCQWGPLGLRLGHADADYYFIECGNELLKLMKEDGRARDILAEM